MSIRNILVTYALTYSNGPIHIGHMLGYIQADIWVRYQNMKGNNCQYISGSDTHGTPITLAAEKKNQSVKYFVDKIVSDHKKDLKNFLISLDEFQRTDTKANKMLVEDIYKKLLENDDIKSQNINQIYDTEKSIFLPDRYVIGCCPKCNASKQYGDGCEVCGTFYDAIDLQNPTSIFSKKPVIQKKTKHYFFKIKKYQRNLQDWIKKSTQNSIINKLNEWLDFDLKDWNISRDAPYLGFKIPNNPKKYFYVWFDAPIGYISSFQSLHKKRKKLPSYWDSNNQDEIYQFIGKDISYFHTIFWPILLFAYKKFRLPTAIYSHGFLTVNGKKMSKSRGNFISAKKYIKFINPEYLRYYYASKLNNTINDIDLNIYDFQLKINTDLIGKFINLVSRCSVFIKNNNNNILSSSLVDKKLYQKFVNISCDISRYYENREFSKSIRIIMKLCDTLNKFIEYYKPWKLVHENKKKLANQICSQVINLFKILMIYLKPVLPITAKKVEDFLNIKSLQWKDIYNPLFNHKINIFIPLLKRIDKKSLESLFK